MKTWLQVPTVQIALGGMLLIAVVSLWTSTRTYKLEFSRIANEAPAQPVDQPMEPMDPKDFALKDAKGRTVRLSDFKGKPVLLNFWASWCPPCVEEMPALLAFGQWAKKELGAEVLAVTVDENWGAVEKMFREKNFWSGKELPITILLNSKTDVAQAWGTLKYPETYFINRAHKVVQKFVGGRNWTSQEMMQWVREHSN